MDIQKKIQQLKSIPRSVVLQDDDGDYFYKVTEEDGTKTFFDFNDQELFKSKSIPEIIKFARDNKLEVIDPVEVGIQKAAGLIEKLEKITNKKVILKEDNIAVIQPRDIFEEYQDTDVSGMAAEIAIDELIIEFKERVADAIKQIGNGYQPGDENKLRIAIKKLWISKINQWKTSEGIMKEGFAVQTPAAGGSNLPPF